jgi:hypothetical protein
MTVDKMTVDKITANRNIPEKTTVVKMTVKQNDQNDCRQNVMLPPVQNHSESIGTM